MCASCIRNSTIARPEHLRVAPDQEQRADRGSRGRQSKRARRSGGSDSGSTNRP
jgi:hypothetical protein